MLIEVLKTKRDSNKDKGDLLEDLAANLLGIRGFEVARQIRKTGAELDLLCKEKVSGREVYVECKAHRDPLSVSVLNQLLGTVTFNKYSEGWLVTAGPLSKDSRGFVDDWERRPQTERGHLSFYTPERIVDSLVSAKLISAAPESTARRVLAFDESLSIGNWALLVSEWGQFWSCPILENGLPREVALFVATDGRMLTDRSVYDRLSLTDWTSKDLDFFVAALDGELGKKTQTEESGRTPVVTVEHGAEWHDYRPARPQDFVGRKSAQRDLLTFFTDVKKRRTDTRVFAIKGDSGIGKSSLLAKMREVARMSRKPNNLFLFAVDVRAATDASYIGSSLLTALREASSCGFGNELELSITNHADPLQSESIAEFLADCERKHELIILVFDQFEELYAKSNLYSVFEAAKAAMISSIAYSGNLILGFAWKTDSSIPQDHPAYYMWHELADHRYEITLKPFSHADAESAMQLFEAELGEKIQTELKRYLIENSQGYPWLLKKLCIHFREQLLSGVSQHQLADRALDVAALFDRDLSGLSEPEMGCLKLVAENAPMDWYEVLQSAGVDVVQSLQQKRLLIRRGDNLNLYWDIFRDYVLLRTVPAIPFTHIPQSPSVDALLRVAVQLDVGQGRTLTELAETSKLKESTVGNIMHDLEAFAVSQSVDGKHVVDPHVREISARSVLTRIRLKLKRHALTEQLRSNHANVPAQVHEMVEYLRQINPIAQHHSRTWNTYANRMAIWLEIVGLARRSANGLLYLDSGEVNAESLRKASRRRRMTMFLGDASPAKSIETLDYLKKHEMNQETMNSMGLRNACAVLYRFNLIDLMEGRRYAVPQSTLEMGTSKEAVWEKARSDETLMLVVNALVREPALSANEVGTLVAKYYDRDWSPASKVRVGNGLKQWSRWLVTPSTSEGEIPEPPGRQIDASQEDAQFHFHYS